MSILLADIDATCAALGFYDGEHYLAEPDAIKCLKHLIWILRRDLDNHEYRRHMGNAKILQSDLVYMLPDYIHDEEYADVLLRLLVALTSPTLLLYRDGPPKDNHGRKIYLELVDISQGYKTAFTREEVWVCFYGKIKKSLEIDWALRSEEQNLVIERILVLIRNVLQVPANPEAECRADNDASVHDQVIWALHRSGIMDLVLFIVSSQDEHQFHLHCLEILCLLYREQTAESLADASLQRSFVEKQRDEQELIAALRREKQGKLLTKPPPGRHSRFGGTYVIRNLKSVSDRDIICHQALERVVAIDFDREKKKQKRSFRHVKEEAQATRRSAFAVRLCLREFCVEVLRSAYNTLVRHVRRVVERNIGSPNHDDSYLLWAIRFFMEFNRLSGMQLSLVSESLSVQYFHWVLTRMQHDMDSIATDKKQARLWAKRLHVGLQTFRELLLSMLALQKLNDDIALALFDMLLNNVCYVLEYRETVLYLIMNYNETHSTKAYLRDVIETANIFIKMMEKFCKGTVVVQDRKRKKKKSAAQKKKAALPEKTQEEIQEEYENKWSEHLSALSSLLVNELELAEEDQPIPFDAASEKSIDDQKDDCMKRIHRFLHEEQLEKAVSLLRAAREVWPENDIFGSITAAPEDELLLLREIFLHNITTVEKSNESNDDEDANNDTDNEEYEDMDDNVLVEKTFKFEDFVKRLLNPKIVRACILVLNEWEHIPTKSLKAAVTILHRIAYGCSCPAMLFHARLFLIFQQVFNAARDAHHEELRRLGVYVVRKFAEIAPSNPKIYAELLFYKTIKEANELESGYCDAYESGTKGAWSEEQENELRLLFEENQRNPATDKDVIDWILENLIDKNRTRRGVLKKLKELGLMFKAPTKKSTAAGAGGKNAWKPEEDEELRNLYDTYRTEEDCLMRIMQSFWDRRGKQQIIKRMLQLHMIADKSEILPKKRRERKSKKKKQNSSDRESENDDDMDEENYMEEPMFGHEQGTSRSAPNATMKAKKKTAKKAAKPKRRKVTRKALDVGTLRALVEQIDTDQFQVAIDWLKNSLEEAANEEDAPTEEEDAIPIVPLTQVQRDAMENADFKKLLIAMSLQPPIMGSETYWRIPIHLNSADLNIRAKILAGEAIEIEECKDGEDAAVTEDDDDDSDDDDGDDDSDDDDDDDDGVEMENGNVTNNYEKFEEDTSDIFAKQRERLNTLLFSKRDEDNEMRKPPMKGKNLKKEKGKKSKFIDDDEEHEEITEIKRKLEKKKRHPELSSDEEIQYDINGEMEFPSSSSKSKKYENKKEKEKQKQNTAATAVPSVNADELFNQLKAQRNRKQKKTNSPLSDNKRQNSNRNSVDNDDLLNFNSEDYRKRLLELGGDSDEDEMDTNKDAELNAGNDVEGEKMRIKSNHNEKKRKRRINMIDSDSDEEENENDNNKDNTKVNDNDTDNNDSNYDDSLIVNEKSVRAEVVCTVDDVNKTSNQAHPIDDIRDDEENAGGIYGKKRRLSLNTTLDDDVNSKEHAINGAYETEDGAVLIKRRKFAMSLVDDVNDNDNDNGNDNDDNDNEDEANVESAAKEPVKSRRRRLAIVDDDDDDDEDDGNKDNE